MTVYLILLVIVISIFIQKYSIRKYLDTSILLILIALATLRGHSVGADTPTYLEYYTNAISLKYHLDGLKEFGFYYLIYLLRLVTDNQIVFFLLISFLTYIPLFIFLKKTSKNISLSLFLYIVMGYYTQSFNIIRQSIAMSLILLALYFLSLRSYKKSIFFYVLATQFHFSAIALAIIYPIRFLKIKFANALIIMIISFMIGLYLVSNSNIINNFIFLQLSGFTGTVLGKFEFMTNMNVPYLNIYGMIALSLPLSILAVFAYKRMPEDFFTKVFFIGTIINNILISNVILLRFPYYLTILSIVIVPSLLIKSKGSTEKLFLIALIFFIVLFFIYSGYNLAITSTKNHLPNSFPYYFLFE